VEPGDGVKEVEGRNNPAPAGNASPIVQFIASSLY